MQTRENPVRDLFLAARANDLAAARKAVAAGASPNARLSDWENKTPLHAAAAKGNAEMVRLLIELGADVNAADSAGETPLSVAAFRGRTDCVRALIEGKANANTRSKGGWTPLMAAASEGHSDVVQMLLAAGAKSNPKAVELAGRHGHTKVTALLRGK